MLLGRYLGTTPEVVEVRKIWDKGAHNAFTDLVRWNEKFYCAFREGRGHVSTDGKIRVLESKDANLWESAVLAALGGYDLRDAHLSVTPDGRLMLMGGAAPRKKDNQAAPTGTFVSFSQDGERWIRPQIVVQQGRWLWRVTWHKGNAYGVSKASAYSVSYGAKEGMPYIDVKNGTMTKLLKLPSGGDTSYPGLVWHNDMLYVSYYSSHEGKASIYLAKVKVKPNAAAQDETFGAEPNPTGDPRRRR